MNTLINGLIQLKSRLLNKKIWLLSFMLFWNVQTLAATQTLLADMPLFSGASVPGNVALSLSVEFPTALGSSYTTSYNKSNEYLGYWDANKCYSYVVNTTSLTGLLFNTGVNSSGVALSNGSTDPHWTATSSPSGITNSNASKVNTSWGLSDSDSSYIGGSSSIGTFVYQTTINIPLSVDPTKVEVSFELYADDRLDAVKVNGVDTGISAPSISWSTSGIVTIPAGTFVNTGSNTISLDVYNTGTGLGGMRIDNMTVKVVSPDGNYFVPQAAATSHACNTVTNGRWSGNFLNWALTQTIDPLRLALTGGYRSVDTVGLTVLEKAWASGQGGTVASPTISSNSTLISQSTPFSFSTLKIRISGLGNKFYFTSTGNNNSPGTVLSDSAVTSSPTAGSVYQMYARVQACKPSLLETNCTQYPNGDYKPTGLIQKNALNLNFAAFGYLNDANQYRDGGVLRAKMAPLGPYYKSGVSGVLTNPNPEWSEDTGIFYSNPDASDASASGVSNSGVINYLNKFGLTAPGYKTYDPVGELYYATARYFRNKGNVTEYTSGATSYMKDGFPVITTWDDPVKYSCQSNFIIGVGDTNSWSDANLPGSNVRVQEPTMPAQVAADFGSLTDAAVHYMDASTSTNRIGAMEGTGNLGNVNVPWCCGYDSYLMAGLAYDLHTRDFRLDMDGTQTISTYWLDVLESGDRKDYGSTGTRNQFWLTAKYGGFEVPAGFAPYTGSATALATADWDTNNDGDPDNYYRANEPKKMIDGLNSAFESIAAKVLGSSNAFAIVSSTVQSGDLAFATSYDTDSWNGDVIGSTVTFDTNNDPITTPIWHARSKVESQNWDTGRAIATASCATVYSDGQKSCTGVPFRLTNLLTSNKTDLGSSSSVQQIILNYLRGDRSNESSGLRVRKYILGDIVNSKVIAVGKPSAPYSDASNPNYSTFKTTYASRYNMAYVGANDGMLHAIKGTSDSSGGTELFAYVPSMTFHGPNGTPATDGLAALSKSSFIHHAYVDSTPVVTDVNFGADTTTGADWHSLLVGGLGKGGKGYYAIDVTNPGGISNETSLASAVKWEFTHNDMGYSYGKPVIVKIDANDVAAIPTVYKGWAVIVTSGYNNADGNGYFFVLNAKTGQLIKKIPTYTTSPSSDAGLASLNAFIPDFGQYKADAAYAGDLLGNVWRLDLSTLSVQKIASLKDSSGNAQQVTVAPLIEVDKATGKRFVFVGTGKLLDDSDLPNTRDNSFYAINDGTSAFGGFYNSTTLPGTLTFPIARTNLDDNTATYATTGVVSPMTNSMGWYVDLADKYRINVDMVSNVGLVAFVANKPSSTVCSSSNTSNGDSQTYVLSYAQGRPGVAGGYVQASYLAKYLAFYKAGTDAPAKLAITDENGNFIKTPDLIQGSSINFQMLNWRDLPTAD